MHGMHIDDRMQHCQYGAHLPICPSCSIVPSTEHGHNYYESEETNFYVYRSCVFKNRKYKSVIKIRITWNILFIETK